MPTLIEKGFFFFLCLQRVLELSCLVSLPALIRFYLLEVSPTFAGDTTGFRTLLFVSLMLHMRLLNVVFIVVVVVVSSHHQ